jgi:hypothetical protein
MWVRPRVITKSSDLNRLAAPQSELRQALENSFHMAWSKIEVPVLALGTCATLLLSWLLLWDHTEQHPFAELTPGPASERLVALIVFQESDCNENLERMVHLVAEAERSQPLDLHGLFVGSNKGLTVAKETVGSLVVPFHVTKAGPRAIRATRQFGHLQTPFLVVVDADGRIPLTAGIPGNEEEEEALRMRFTSLFTMEHGSD